MLKCFNGGTWYSQCRCGFCELRYCQRKTWLNLKQSWFYDRRFWISWSDSRLGCWNPSFVNLSRISECIELGLSRHLNPVSRIRRIQNQNQPERVENRICGYPNEWIKPTKEERHKTYGQENFHYQTTTAAYQRQSAGFCDG